MAILSTFLNSERKCDLLQQRVPFKPVDLTCSEGLKGSQLDTLPIRVCRKTFFSSDQFETPGELSLGMDY